MDLASPLLAMGWLKFGGLSLDLYGNSKVGSFLLQLMLWALAQNPQEFSPFRPEIRQGYPLNLSISISGGKETNQDSLSNGERNGKSPT